MDAVKAAILEERFIGKELGGWTVIKLVDNGKSAAVFRAEKNGQLAAVKIFDSDIIERYGDQAQLGRIKREVELVGKSHPHLVTIYGGGHDEATDAYYIVMEFLDGPNLKKALPGVSPQDIPFLVAQLAKAAKFLEENGLVHRDIKPENIVLMESGRRLVLLDLGVIRPIKGSDLTDPDGVQAFIGTLQYSSPEFLLREEKKTVEGYRSLTFYQIGAVLHDLIMKRPIFEQFANPFAKLVNAVQQERPIIVNQDVSQRLIQLAERCLVKNPATRLRLVQWEDFEETLDRVPTSAKDRLSERMITIRAQRDEAGGVERQPIGRRVVQNIIASLRSAALAARSSVNGLPRFRHETSASETGLVKFILETSPELGFPHGLVVQVKVEILDPTEGIVSCSGCAAFQKASDTCVPSDFTPWYEGVVEMAQLHKDFEEFFFEAIDWAMLTAPGVDPDFKGIFARGRALANG